MNLRIATFNVENLDIKRGRFGPTLQDRIKVLRPQLQRLRADILCLQEVHAQDAPEGERALQALDDLLAETEYATLDVGHAVTSSNTLYRYRNLVVVSRFPITQVKQYNNDLIETPQYQMVTPTTPQTPKPVRVQRPILHTTITVPDTAGSIALDVINLHLKSRRPSDVPTQITEAAGTEHWRSVSGWAEGYFISSLKRVSQALETRILVDKIFDEQGEDAKIVVCGDLNAHPDEVPVEAIAGRLENTQNAELVPRSLLPLEYTIPESARYTYIHQGHKRLLDHMLVSRGLLSHYRHSEIHNETLHDESIAWAYDDKFPESDHAPFVAEFAL